MHVQLLLGEIDYEPPRCSGHHCLCTRYSDERATFFLSNHIRIVCHSCGNEFWHTSDLWEHYYGDSNKCRTRRAK